MPEFLAGSPFAIGILQMVLATIVMAVNYRFFANGVKGVLHGAPNMESPVADEVFVKVITEDGYKVLEI